MEEWIDTNIFSANVATNPITYPSNYDAKYFTKIIPEECYWQSFKVSFLKTQVCIRFSDLNSKRFNSTAEILHRNTTNNIVLTCIVQQYETPPSYPVNLQYTVI